MRACTFFGHRTCSDDIQPKLREILTDLIENHSVNMFYVGNQGTFDQFVHSALRELAKTYPHISYTIVLEKFPSKRGSYDTYDYADTMLPEGIENVHPKYAISWRNRWMLRQSEYVVTYVTHSWGGAAQFAEKAEKQGKVVIKL